MWITEVNVFSLNVFNVTIEGYFMVITTISKQALVHDS